jgi:micrococcal nuclease
MDLDIDLGLHVHIKERIRLFTVNTPEIFGVDKESDEYANGVAAKLFVEKKVLNKTVWLHTHRDKTGKYGRYLGELYIQDEEGKHVSLGKMLLDEELATKIED